MRVKGKIAKRRTVAKERKGGRKTVKTRYMWCKTRKRAAVGSRGGVIEAGKSNAAASEEGFSGTESQNPPPLGKKGTGRISARTKN